MPPPPPWVLWRLVGFTATTKKLHLASSANGDEAIWAGAETEAGVFMCTRVGTLSFFTGDTAFVWLLPTNWCLLNILRQEAALARFYGQQLHRRKCEILSTYDVSRLLISCGDVQEDLGANLFAFATMGLEQRSPPPQPPCNSDQSIASAARGQLPQGTLLSICACHVRWQWPV